MEMYFYKRNENIFEKTTSTGSEDDSSQDINLKKIQDSFLKVLDNKNLSFLIGSGCSSFEEEGSQIGIPVMAPLTKEFYDSTAFKNYKDDLKTKLKIDVKDDKFSTNLELFLSTLHSLSFFLSKQSGSDENESLEKVQNLIREARNFLLEKCLNENNSKSEKDKPS